MRCARTSANKCCGGAHGTATHARCHDVQMSIAALTVPPCWQYLQDVRDWGDLMPFMHRCWFPFMFNNASWAVDDGNTETPNDPIITQTAWNWPGVQLQDPTMQRTGPMMIWQVRGKTGNNYAGCGSGSSGNELPYICNNPGTLGPFNLSQVGGTDHPQPANRTLGKVYLPYQDFQILGDWNQGLGTPGNMYNTEGYFYQWFYDATAYDVIFHMHDASSRY